MERKGEEPIIMRQVRVTEVDVEPVELWFEVPVFVDMQRSAKVDVKVLEANLNFALIWEPYRISGLNSSNFPFFYSREVNHNFWNSKLVSELKLNVLNVKLWNIVGDISPLYRPLHIAKEPAKVIHFVCWQAHIGHYIMGKEVLH